jgi:type III pantothenate kinase
MKWLIDLGNTRLKLATMDAPSSPALFALSSLQTSADWMHALEKISSTDRVYVCTVANQQQKDRMLLALSNIGAECIFASVGEHAAGISTQYDISRLGIDRFLQLIAARRVNACAQLVVSVGSAMTVDLIDAQGVHRGGWIAPRDQHLRDALTNNFPVLDLPLGEPHDFALSTADAISSGINAMQRGSVQYAQQRAQERLQVSVDVLFCGGGARVLAEFFPNAPYHPWLALNGLVYWAQWREST